VNADSNIIIACGGADSLAQREEMPLTDEDKLACLEELRTPLEKVYADEFERYLELFYRYLPKKPFHARARYGGGFICQKGKKKTGEEYFRACYPALIARMLDHDRQRLVIQKYQTPNYWIALNTGMKSTLKAIDFDNKQNLFGYYRCGASDDWSPRPLPTLHLEHLQAVKRLYDAFPRHTWCISSATLGLHVWEKLPRPLPIDAIHASNQPRLREIGLGGTEIHPMFGRCFRRPFGADYYTITDSGLLEHWTDQLNYFENVAQPPKFNAIYQAMRSLLLKEWSGYLGNRNMEKISSTAGKPHLLKYFRGKNLINAGQIEEDLKVLDAWAENGFPQSLPVSVPVVSDLSHLEPVGQQPTNADQQKDLSRAEESGCDIDLSAVCDSQWVQNCEKWAKGGLPCHDSVFPVVSQLTRWFWFIEFWDLPEDMRLERILGLMMEFCLTKHNGFISSLNTGHERDFRKRISRIVSCAIKKVDDSGQWQFDRVRQKRQQGQYRRIIFLEPVVLGESRKANRKDKDSFLPVGLIICCSDLGKEIGQKEQLTGLPDIKTSPSPLGDLAEVNNTDTRRMEAEKWIFEPDDTPLPEELTKLIEGAYGQAGRRLFKPTMKKVARLLNYLWMKGGEARLGVKALAKMGFPDHNSRKHLELLADAGIVQRLKGYSPVMGRGIRHRLTKRTMTMFGTVKRKSETA